MTFHLVKVEKNNRYLVQTVNIIEEVIPFIETQHPEHVEHLEDVNFDDFKNEVDTGNEYKSGLYIVEHPDCICVLSCINKHLFWLFI